MPPIISMLYNQKTSRYHPILFLHYPMPGLDGYKIPRYKSKFHHTEGFGLFSEAATHIERELAGKVEEHFDKPIINIHNGQFDWDGEGVPAIVEFFQIGEKDA